MHFSNKYSPFGRGKSKWACWPMSPRSLDCRIFRYSLNADRWGYSSYFKEIEVCLAMRDNFCDKAGRPRYYQTNSWYHGARQKSNGAWHGGPSMKPCRQHANRKHRSKEKKIIRQALKAIDFYDIDSFKISTGWWD